MSQFTTLVIIDLEEGEVLVDKVNKVMNQFIYSPKNYNNTSKIKEFKINNTCTQVKDLNICINDIEKQKLKREYNYFVTKGDYLNNKESCIKTFPNFDIYMKHSIYPKINAVIDTNEKWYEVGREINKINGKVNTSTKCYESDLNIFITTYINLLEDANKESYIVLVDCLN